MGELILSCEHGGCEIPAAWRSRWRGADELLHSHRGLDHGALELAEDLSSALDAPLAAETVTRLLIDLNRDEDGRTLFTGEAFELGEEDRRRLLDRYWRPHRQRLRELIVAALVSGGRAAFLSIHSFTPVWEGRVRDIDIGLLIDPDRPCDRELAETLRRELSGRDPGLRIAINRPYSGLEEGIDRSLRQEFASRPLRVLTLELNQRHPLGDPDLWAGLRENVVQAVRASLED